METFHLKVSIGSSQFGNWPTTLTWTHGPTQSGPSMAIAMIARPTDVMYSTYDRCFIAGLLLRWHSEHQARQITALILIHG